MEHGLLVSLKTRPSSFFDNPTAWFSILPRSVEKAVHNTGPVNKCLNKILGVICFSIEDITKCKIKPGPSSGTCSGLLRATKKPDSHYQLPSQTSFKSLKKAFLWSHSKVKTALFRATTKTKVWIFRTFSHFLVFINTYAESP